MQSSPVVQVIVDNEFIRELAEKEIKRIVESSGTWWDMKRLESETCRKRDWLIENILLNPKFREEMKVISNNREGGRWMFRAGEMRSFLDKHFHHLNRTK